MLLPYRVKVSDTKVTNFTPILALCTCLYRSHLRKPVSMKQIKHSWKSEAQNLCSNCPPTFTRYGSNITNVWQEFFTPMTLAFSCEVVHEKSVNICKSYSKKISGTFFSGHDVYMHTVGSACYCFFILSACHFLSGSRGARMPVNWWWCWRWWWWLSLSCCAVWLHATVSGIAKPGQLLAILGAR